MVNNLKDLSLLKNIYGGTKLYVYGQGESYEGWFIVPVYWGAQSYAVACFDPKGIQHPQWHNCDTIEIALNVGKALVRQHLSSVDNLYPSV